MIFYPKLKAKASYRQRLEVFKGYNRSRRIGAGEFEDMENLTADDYPVLSVRKKRGLLDCLQGGGYSTGMLYVPGHGLVITANHQVEQDDGEHDDGEYGALYLLNRQGKVQCICDDLLPGKKSLALMGKSLIVAPDMVAVNLDTLSHRKMEYDLEVSEGLVYYRMCKADGTTFSPLTSSDAAPAEPKDGDYWLDKTEQLRQYSAVQESWIIVTAICTKMWGPGISNHGFRPGDTVTITGSAALNGRYFVCSTDQDAVVVDLSIMGSGAVDCDSDHKLTIVRGVPQLDYIVEAGNRLWGCNRNTNEIYASKLGDYKNWNCFQGLSTDSWVGNVGTADEFTGAAVQNSYPVFYKENCKHKVWPSATGAHQITTVTCNGVEKNSEGSIAVFEGIVFYKSAFGVFADDGGGFTEIGQPLGQAPYHNANGAIHDGKYYLSMVNSQGRRELFVYDMTRRMWHRQNGISGVLCSAGNSLYGVVGGEIWDLTGNTGQLEKNVSWFAVTGDLGLEVPEQKYISRLTLRLSLEPGAKLEVYARYDRKSPWVKLGQAYGTDLRSFSLPVHPRRCDQLQLKLQGRGMCRLYSITQTLEKGSELS